ncbi:hypothetical protein B0H66DRAFT_101945 [Apodospora peruviana]|uniref:Uncharacterized protein n=1 Tax=Apodospora peruviana TaxID=516989 RepID=A0AAE0LXZ0_9PEZI|nr:hypothetical protein B0H66DRAFT_101945 [Apodospora peruviana]
MQSRASLNSRPSAMPPLLRFRMNSKSSRRRVDLQALPCQPKCTLSRLQIRREWNMLSSAEKKDNIRGVKCLQSKLAKTHSSLVLVPGAKSRYDDFIATYINQTMTIRWTGNFLVWHRYNTWLLENSAIFDGSDTSMSGNGVFFPNKARPLPRRQRRPSRPLPPLRHGW